MRDGSRRLVGVCAPKATATVVVVVKAVSLRWQCHPAMAAAGDTHGLSFGLLAVLAQFRCQKFCQNF
jgi:hypothetical protein